MPIDIDGLSFEELLELNQRVVARLKMLESMQAHVEMMAFNIGARVSFEAQNGRLLGTLVKYNRKTVTVVTGQSRPLLTHADYRSRFFLLGAAG